jgi:hypothetical protein
MGNENPAPGEHQYSGNCAAAKYSTWNIGMRGGHGGGKDEAGIKSLSIPGLARIEADSA